MATGVNTAACAPGQVDTDANGRPTAEFRARCDAQSIPAGRILVIGLGNPLVSDDSVGLRVAQALQKPLLDRPSVEVTEDYWGGLRLMERMIGYDSAIVIDAICTGASAGTIHYLTTDAISTQKSASAHDVNLPTALAFGRQAGAHVPADRNVHLVGIEAQDVINFGDHCTAPVPAAIPRAVQRVLELIEALRAARDPVELPWDATRSD